MVPPVAAAQNAGSPLNRRLENLALVYQELLTIVERMRSNRQQVPDADQFRKWAMGNLDVLLQESMRRGYTREDAQLAEFAVIAFLDESILTLRLPAFTDWPKQPLQLLRYGHQIAGEIFFKNLEILLGRADSQELADLLEVYQLCMLLGFKGRYAIDMKGELGNIINATSQKIRRIRQTGPEISPRWRIPRDTFVFSAADAWVKRFIIACASCVVLAIVLFIIYKLTLSGGVTSLRDLTATIR